MTVAILSILEENTASVSLIGSMSRSNRLRNSSAPGRPLEAVSAYCDRLPPPTLAGLAPDGTAPSAAGNAVSGLSSPKSSDPPARPGSVFACRMCIRQSGPCTASMTSRHITPSSWMVVDVASPRRTAGRRPEPARQVCHSLHESRSGASHSSALMLSSISSALWSPVVMTPLVLR